MRVSNGSSTGTVRLWFFDEPKRRPDACPGEQPDEFCLEEIDGRHSMDDHRRCSPQDCDGAVKVPRLPVSVRLTHGSQGRSSAS